MATQDKGNPIRLGWILTAFAAIALFIAFTIWGGIPTDAQAGVFWAQAGVFLLVICAFVLVLWHLLIRPLAPNLRQPKIDSLPARLRQGIALILASGGISIFVGGVWDELWHRSYGIPFGEDLFWRPHLLMYFGFATAIVAGAWALIYLNRNLRGNFQQRFRSNTVVGLLILNAAFLLYALPADPVWHWIFGEDITAWSVPHLILLASFVLTQLLALVLHVSTLRRQKWHVHIRISAQRQFIAADPRRHLIAVAAAHAYRLGRVADRHPPGMAGALSPGMVAGGELAGRRDIGGSSCYACVAVRGCSDCCRVARFGYSLRDDTAI